MAKLTRSPLRLASLAGLLAIVASPMTTQANAGQGGYPGNMKGPSNTVQSPSTGWRPYDAYGEGKKTAPPVYAPGPVRHLYDPSAAPTGTMTSNAAQNGVFRKGP
jgi:hypothetical protein